MNTERYTARTAVGALVGFNRDMVELMASAQLWADTRIESVFVTDEDGESLEIVPTLTNLGSL